MNSDISSTYCVNMQGEGTSKKPLSSGDETCVSLSNGFEVQGAGNVEDRLKVSTSTVTFHRSVLMIRSFVK